MNDRQGTTRYLLLSYGSHCLMLIKISDGELLLSSNESATSDSDSADSADSGDATSAKPPPNDYDSRNMHNLFANSEVADHENLWAGSPHVTLDYASAKATGDSVKELKEMLDITDLEQHGMEVHVLPVKNIFDGPNGSSTIIRTVKQEVSD